MKKDLKVTKKEKVLKSLKKRGLNFLRNKNYQKAIEVFNLFIRKHESYYDYNLITINVFPWVLDDLHEIYFFRSFTFSLLKKFDNANADFSFLMQSDYGWSYPYFLLFTQEVLKNDTNEAIKYYYKLRKDSKELIHFEKDLLTHLQINNTLEKTIELINYSL